MRKYLGIITCIFCACTCAMAQNRIMCNPIDLQYRYSMDGKGYREAADPTVMPYNGGFLLFPSKSGGYWWSENLVDWAYIKADGIDRIEDYAPTTITVRDTVYYLASDMKEHPLYRCADPLSGKWECAVDRVETETVLWDPCFLMDDDGRLYMYYGIVNDLRGVEISYSDGRWQPLGEPVLLVKSDKRHRGWEIPGDDNDLTRLGPCAEGSWVNKIGDKFYYQYASPGTQYSSYCDAVLVSDNPLGPFTLQEMNPFSWKPGGFVTGAGHGSTFTDNYGNIWHAASNTISIHDMYERTLSMWPVFLDDDGILYTDTSFGDYPHEIPEMKVDGPGDWKPSAMLLSKGKKVTASSEKENHPVLASVDEDIRSWWSASEGGTQWLMVDLGENEDITGIQVNFADEEMEGAVAREWNGARKYILEYSRDGKRWHTAADMRNNADDRPHRYHPLTKPVMARYVRLTDFGTDKGKCAVSGLRVFGHSHTPAPCMPSFSVTRDEKDARHAVVAIQPVNGAQGYNIRFGTAPDKLYLCRQTFESGKIDIRSLETGKSYWFSVESYGEGGISPQAPVQALK